MHEKCAGFCKKSLSHLRFLLPGERELTAEQWLDVAWGSKKQSFYLAAKTEAIAVSRSTLPLGTSRAEMQQLFLKAGIGATLSVMPLDSCMCKSKLIETMGGRVDLARWMQTAPARLR